VSPSPERNDVNIRLGPEGNTGSRILKITKVETTPVSVPTISYRDAYGQFKVYRAVIVRIETDEKIVGYGEAHANYPELYGESLDSVNSTIRNIFTPLLIGKDPFRIQYIYDLMEAASTRTPCAKTGVDMALYDIMGKAVNQPVHNLIGGLVFEKIPIAIEIGMRSPEEMAEEAADWVRRGLTVVKIKAGHGGIEEDLRRIKAIRDAVGDEVKLRVDPNTHWTVAESKRACKYLSGLNFEYLEQPIPAWNLDGMAEIRSQTGVAINADEAAFTVYDVMELSRRKAADVINMKVPKVGGILQAKKVAAVADAVGMGCMLGAEGEVAVCIAAKAHIAASTRNAIYASDFTELSTLKAHLLNEPFEMDRTGRIDVPRGPGLGVTINEDALKKYAV